MSGRKIESSQRVEHRQVRLQTGEAICRTGPKHKERVPP